MPDQPPSLTEQEIVDAVARCPEPVRYLFEGWLRGTHTLAGDLIDNAVEEETDMSQVAVETTERRHVRALPGVALTDRIGNAITHIDPTLNEVELNTGEIVGKPATERRHVRVWFGEHVIAEFVAKPLLAERYAAAMDKRFAGLKITTDVVLPGETPVRALPLPSDRLWGTTPN